MSESEIEAIVTSEKWPQNVDAFTLGYMQAMFFAECNSDDPELEDMAMVDLATEARRDIVRDCAKFQTEMAATLEALGAARLETSEAWGERGRDSDGMDFYFTRNGHGVGFWDRGYPKPLADALTGACGYGTQFAAASLYKGDDGKLYLS
jgi:hypothetical protein